MRLNLTICRADEVVNRIRTARDDPPFHAVISLEHPCDETLTPKEGRAPRLDKELGAGWKDRQLILQCWDIEKPVNGFSAPGPEVVLAALAHTKKWCPPDEDEMRLLVHCRAGKARSTALALVLQRAFARHLSDKECLERVLQARPSAAPNIAIVAHGDKILDCRGSLIQAVEDDPVITERRKKTDANRHHQFESMGLA